MTKKFTKRWLNHWLLKNAKYNHSGIPPHILAAIAKPDQYEELARMLDKPSSPAKMASHFAQHLTNPSKF